MFRDQAILLYVGLAFVLFSVPALAGGGDNDDDMFRFMGRTNVISAEMIKDGTLRLTPDEHKLIRLNQDAASVIVNNPVHAEVLLDSPRLLIVMPRQPGTTLFTVLNALGETVLQKIIIVTNVKSKHVRIRRICSRDDPSCVPTAYYYCPDGCYEVTPVVQKGSNAPPPPILGRGARISASSAPSTPDTSPNTNSNEPAPQN